MSEPIVTPTPAPAPESTPAKTFTQEEVDAMIGKRLAKAMKGLPSEDELNAFRTWKGDRDADQRREAEHERTRAALATAQSELEQLRRDKYVLAKGLTGDEAEFIAYKAAKLVDDKTTFEQAVDQLTENRQKVTFDWTAQAGGNSKEETVNAAMNSLIRGAIK